MIVTRTPDSFDQPLPLDIRCGTSVTIGNFDGVHLGHQALLELTRTHAIAGGTLPVAVTFDPHPLEVLTPHAPPRLTTTRERLALLDAAGMALVVLLTFTRELAAMPPDLFVRRILLDGLNMRQLFLGYDFSLGKGRAGTPEVLARLGEHEGFQVDQLPALSVHEDVVSSTRIRELLRLGQVWEASALLGRPYSVRGEVIHGQNRGGRLLGFPTANLAPSPIMLPKPGVYVTLATPSEGQGTGLPAVLSSASCSANTFPAVTNIGHNPTFGPGALTIETHLLDFDQDLYGKQLDVAFVERLRGEISFTGPDMLVAQIRKDTAKARAVLKAQ
ncbi:MAG: bifunctional riboflavin kinase/FAD synthetase [Bilophila sp.]